MTAPINNTFFADPQGLNAIRQDAKAQNPAALKEAAKQFESLFTQMLLKSMREANKSFGESMFESEQTEFYQDMFDDQMAVHLSQGRGLGLADMLVRQLQQGVGSAEGSGLGARGLGQNAASSTESNPSVSSFPTEPRARSPEPLSKSDFIQQMLPHAEAAARDLGVDPHALLAQAALETGWGKSMPCNAAGECSFNLFGIKAGSQWSGASVNVPTLEFEEGVAVRKVERFRAYESPADSFRDYARLIGGSARYENAVGTGDNVAAFASALQKGGYATDPNYARKLVAVADQLRSMTKSGGM
jgi:peptidoglycan hydrolase FlgJ